MSRYKKLFMNTLFFAFGNLGSKLIQFILLPYYTRVLTTSEYGTVDLVIQATAFSVPLISVCIYDAVIRFAMDKAYNPKNVLVEALRFSFVAIIIGSLVVLLTPLRHLIPHSELFVMITSVQIIRNILAQYIRAIGQVLNYSINGIVQTFILASLNIILISFYNFGAEGYLISIVFAYTISIFMFLAIDNKWYDIIKGRFDKNVLTHMLKYSIPLVPNNILWWGINASNRYFLAYYHGASDSGIYAVANKVPNIITIIFLVFTQAWQLSAIEEYDSEDKASYYTEMYSVLETVLSTSSFLLVILLPIIWPIIGSDYSSALSITPVILLGVYFSCLASYLGTLYLAGKKTNAIFYSTVISALISILANFGFIPKFAGLGAAISSSASFIVLFLYRFIELKNRLRLDVSYWKTIGRFASLLLIVFYVQADTLGLKVLVFIMALTILLLVNAKSYRAIANVALRQLRKRQKSSRS